MTTEVCIHWPCRALWGMSWLNGGAKRNLLLESSAGKGDNDGDKRQKTTFYRNSLVTARERFPGPCRPRKWGLWVLFSAWRQGLCVVGQWNAMPLLVPVLPIEGHRLCPSLESHPISGCFCTTTPHLPGPTGLMGWTLKKKRKKKKTRFFSSGLSGANYNRRRNHRGVWSSKITGRNFREGLGWQLLRLNLSPRQE